MANRKQSPRLKSDKPRTSNSRHADAAALRMRAEDKVREPVAIEKESSSPEEARRTLHELRVHQLELEMQNEELRRAQAEIEASRERYCDLYDMAPVGYLTINEKGLILEANITAATLLGVARSALAKQPLTHFILPEDQDVFYLHRKNLPTTGAAHACELRMMKKDGTTFSAHLASASAQNPKDAPICRVTLTDITKHKQAEDALRRSSERNALLLREVHHRVKNNLTSIIGLLNLQEDAWGNEHSSARSAIRSLEGRVRSMALLHEQLYQTESFEEVSVERYFKSIINHIVSSHTCTDISVATSICYDKLNIETVLPCGLLLNELMENVFKHAFPAGRKGRVSVQFTRDAARGGDGEGGRHWRFAVEDDGVGCRMADLEKNDSLGWRIIRMLCCQLKAEVSCETMSGIRFSIRFKELVYAPRM